MSLKAIQLSIEKVSGLIAPGLGGRIARMAKSTPHLKDVGIKAGIGAAGGAALNVATGDKEKSIAERATKGAIGGGLAGAAFGAGKHILKANTKMNKIQTIPSAPRLTAPKTGLSSPVGIGYKPKGPKTIDVQAERVV